MKKFAQFIADRLSERSTWEAVGFFVGLCGGKFGQGLDWGMAAGLGGAMSAGIKALFPDPVIKP